MFFLQIVKKRKKRNLLSCQTVPLRVCCAQTLVLLSATSVLVPTMNASLLKILVNAVERLPLTKMLFLAIVFLLAMLMFNADKVAFLLNTLR